MYSSNGLNETDEAQQNDACIYMSESSFMQSLPPFYPLIFLACWIALMSNLGRAIVRFRKLPSAESLTSHWILATLRSFTVSFMVCSWKRFVGIINEGSPNRVQA